MLKAPCLLGPALDMAEELRAAVGQQDLGRAETPEEGRPHQVGVLRTARRDQAHHLVVGAAAHH
eukprot:8212505-Lingulodinium_polyedra.AAC.1